ncbi:DUF4435 domain-containing protein [Carnobacterium inhibens]|uniref:DUF4435 domain-containing protein n=1 Tax=Carnobacterium inhibens TaxID=147709 RepID=A0ABR7TBQ5_9LACT|nr:DUF4435 domain-containing protein [Carnobacterium inhibens]MBC9825388.1 DUF4435 domain-containing protein [Carnobacterium inhibens]
MIENSLPIRNDDSVIAEFILWNSGNHDKKLNLFVEDENGHLTYSELLKRKYEDKFVFNIYSCKSRKFVMENYEIWKNKFNHIDNTLFLVDKDFSLWAGEEVADNRNLLTWKYFTLENYLINQDTAFFVMNVLLPGKKIEAIKLLFPDFDSWLENQFSVLKPLFISFAVSHKYKLRKNTSLSPYIFFDEKSSNFNHEQITRYINEIEVECQSKGIDYLKESNEIENYYKTRENSGLHELIKGKYLLTYLIFEINKRAKREKPTLKVISEKDVYFYFILKIPISVFSELWNKIENLLHSNDRV